MSIIKKLLVLMAVAAGVSLGLVGCDKMGKKPAVEHPSKDKSSDEHPSGEHPSKDKSSDDHPSDDK